MLRINSTAASASDGSKEDYVRGYYYIPEDYDPADGIVLHHATGQGISYWEGFQMVRAILTPATRRLM